MPRDVPVADTVEAYLAAVPPAQAQALGELRRTILAAAPGSTERISYGVPTVVHGRAVVGYGITKDRCSLYVMSPPLVRAMAAELAGHDVSGATIHFTPEEPLPTALVRRIVLARLAELAP